MSSIKVTQDNFEKEVVNSDIPVIIDFWAPWCSPCQMMGPVFEELSEEYYGRVKFVKVNTQEEQWLASQFEVKSIPFLMVVNNKQEVGRMVGFVPRELLKKKIDSMLGF